MIEIVLVILLIALVGGVASWLWKQAPIIPEPFKAVGSWVILVVSIILIVLQLIKLVRLI